MLRWMSMHNFIHFIRPQQLTFDEGINFIIGGNSSGKTAVFELIRRCLSNNLSTTASSIPLKDKLAYTICLFNTPKNQMPTWTEDDSAVPEAVIVCLFVMPVTGQDNVSLFYKIFIPIVDNKHFQVFGQRYLSSSNSPYECMHFPRNTCDITTSFVEKIYDRKELKQDEVIGLFQQVDKLQGFTQDEALNARVNNMFEWLTYAYVGILPMRSIGPLQWTRSRLIAPDNKEKNYQQASSQAEILMELLDEKNKDNIDWGIAETYRKHLVYPYSFRKDGSLIFVDNTDAEKSSNQYTRPLLKIPEGVVEAEQLILLLSENRNLTLTLEEPDRGMHPQMINRLRDFVLKRVDNKTVLVISHQPSMIDHFTIGRTYLCTQSMVDGMISHDVRKLPKDFKKYGRVDEMKGLLFSERVLFVEGYTDQIIVEAIFDAVINEKLDTVIYKKLELQENMTDKYKRFISSMHVVELREGKGAGPKKMKYCEEIKRECFVLYDFDLVYKKIDDSEFRIHVDDETYRIKFDKTFKNIDSICDDKTAFSHFEMECEAANTFIWTAKALEDVINQIESSIESNTKQRLDIPIKNSKKWKKELVNKQECDIKNLAIKLITHSTEVQRFLQFFRKMMLRGDEMLEH